MKKSYILIVIIFLTACKLSKEPSGTRGRMGYTSLSKSNSDTLGYIQKNFIDNKQKYTGKDLNTLLRDLEIPVKSYLWDISYETPSLTPSISLHFHSRDQVSKKLDRPDKPFNLIIIWKPGLPQDTVLKMVRANKSTWTKTEADYFGKQIIGDILTTKYEK